MNEESKEQNTKTANYSTPNMSWMLLTDKQNYHDYCGTEPTLLETSRVEDLVGHVLQSSVDLCK